MSKIKTFLEDNAKSVLLGFIALFLCWIGFVIFLNPYDWTFNYADATTWTQILHNFSNGFHPEISYISEYAQLNDVRLAHEYYTFSAFAFGQWWIPLLLLTPIYAIYPYPPMHVYAVIIAVVAIGSFGIYIAIRNIGGTKLTSLAGAVGYCILPQVEHSIFFKGYFDNLGYAIMPYVFAALFGNSWILFYMASFILAMISVPYAYLTIALGVTTILFFKEIKHGIVIAVIAFAVLQIDFAIFEQTRCGMWPAGIHIPGFFTTYVYSRKITTLVKPFLFWLGYLAVLLMTVSFLPFFVVKHKGKWNRQIIGMFFFTALGCSMLLFRGSGWAHHRTAFVVVPIYLSAFYSLILILKDKNESGARFNDYHNKYNLVSLLLISSIVAMSLASTWHYPWVGLSIDKNRRNRFLSLIKPNTERNHEQKQLLSKVDEYVPKEASIAYNIGPSLEAYLHNRRNAWHLGANPSGVEYYILYEYAKSRRPWQKYLQRLRDNNNYKLLYMGDKLYIFKNLHPRPIPRIESTLGWDVLKFWKKCTG